MAHMVFCVRNKKEMEGLDEPPFDSEFGQKIYKNVSKAAWGEWVDRQKMLLNEYRLQPWTPQAQEFLVEQMEQFFFGEGSALPRSLCRLPIEVSAPHASRFSWEIAFRNASQPRAAPCWCKLNQNPMGRLTRAGSIVSGRGSAW